MKRCLLANPVPWIVFRPSEQRCKRLPLARSSHRHSPQQRESASTAGEIPIYFQELLSYGLWGVISERTDSRILLHSPLQGFIGCHERYRGCRAFGVMRDEESVVAGPS